MTTDLPNRPRPILKVAGIVGGALAAIGAAVEGAVSAGYVPDSVATPVEAVVGLLLPLGAALGVWTLSEGKVTPVEDPVNATGAQLVEARTVQDAARDAAPAVADVLASRYPGLLTDAVQSAYSGSTWTPATPSTSGAVYAPQTPATGSTSTVPATDPGTPVYDALADQYGRHAAP